jgi:hypothetical protein
VHPRILRVVGAERPAALEGGAHLGDPDGQRDSRPDSEPPELAARGRLRSASQPALRQRGGQRKERRDLGQERQSEEHGRKHGESPPQQECQGGEGRGHDGLQLEDPGDGLHVGGVYQEEHASEQGSRPGDARPGEQRHEQNSGECVQHHVRHVVAPCLRFEEAPLDGVEEEMGGRVVRGTGGGKPRRIENRGRVAEAELVDLGGSQDDDVVVGDERAVEGPAVQQDARQDECDAQEQQPGRRLRRAARLDGAGLRFGAHVPHRRQGYTRRLAAANDARGRDTAATMPRTFSGPRRLLSSSLV